jgi:cell division protein FtsL
MARTNRRKRKSLEKRRVVAPAWPPHAGPVLLLLAALTVAALVHVHGKLEEICLGYLMAKAIPEHKRLLEKSRKLQVEIATLRSPRRVRAIAMKQLGLIEPLPQQLVLSDHGSKGKLALTLSTSAGDQQIQGNIDPAIR